MGHLIAGINTPILPHLAGIHALHKLTSSCRTGLGSWTSNDGRERKKIDLMIQKRQFCFIQVLPDFTDKCELGDVTPRPKPRCAPRRESVTNL